MKWRSAAVLAVMALGCRVGDLFDSRRATDRLEFSVQPAGAERDEVIEPPVQIMVRTAAGQPDLTYSDTVSIELDQNPAGGTLEGTKRVAAVNGVATFNNLRIDTPGSGFTLRATAPARASATSTQFLITAPGEPPPPPPPPPPPAPATRVTFWIQPTNVEPNQRIYPTVEVVARDASGNRVLSYSGTVTVAIGANPSGGSLSGTTSVVASNGIARFEGLQINRAGNGYTLTAGASGLTGATSSAFNVTTSAPPPPPPPPPPPAPVATRLAFTVQPSNTEVDEPIIPAVRVAARDDAGNTVTSYSGTITIEFAGNDHDANLSGTTAVASNGIAVFNNLRVDKDHRDFRLRAFASGLAAATSDRFDVAKADDDDDATSSATGLRFLTQPGTSRMNQPISPPVSVEVLNAQGAVITSFGGPVTIDLAPNTLNAAAHGTVTVNAVNGVATFTDIRINLVGLGYRLRAAFAGQTPVAVSESFTVVF